MRALAVVLVPLLAAPILVAGCNDASMSDQPKLPAYRSAKVGPGPVPADTVKWRATPEPAPAVTLALLERGQDRYRQFCVPCHSELGDGNGMVVQRGFPRPAAFTDARLRQAPTRHFVDAITNGYGVMYSFAQRVPPADRWAIAAYIRALQRSDGKAADLPSQEVAALPAGPPR